MDCPRCGFAMTDSDVECPRCKLTDAMPPVEAPEPAPGPPTAYPSASDMPPGVPQPPPPGAPVPSNWIIGLVAFVLCLVVGFIVAILTFGYGVGVLLLATSIWVGVDAALINRRDDRIMGTMGCFWGAASFFFWIFVLPLYLVARDQFLRQHGQSRSLLGLYLTAGISLLIVSVAVFLLAWQNGVLE